MRNQWQRLSLLSPISHCLCRHFTTPTMPSTLRPPLSPLTSPPLPSVAAYRSPVHFIPPAYQSPTASAAPFTFVLLYRYPPHYEAEDNPHYTNKPLQFLLKLAQPSSQHASGLAVYEVVLFGDLSVAELEGVLVSNMHWLASVQIAVKGKVVPQSAAIQSLYASQHTTQRDAIRQESRQRLDTRAATDSHSLTAHRCLSAAVLQSLKSLSSSTPTIRLPTALPSMAACPCPVVSSPTSPAIASSTSAPSYSSSHCSCKPQKSAQHAATSTAVIVVAQRMERHSSIGRQW